MTGYNRKQKTVLPRWRLTMFVLLVVPVSGAWWFIDQEEQTVLPVENVKIEGMITNLSPEDMRNRITAVLHGGYFTVDLNAIRNTLLEMPWVQEVSVRRQWPLGLHIKVQEKKAVAYWGGNALISDRAELFIPEKINQHLPLPKLEGPENLHNKVAGFYSELHSRLSPAGIEIRRLSLDKRRAWNIKLANDVEIKLGRADVANRLARLISVITMKGVLDMSNIEVIDLRYPNGFAMRLKNREAKTSASVTEV